MARPADPSSAVAASARFARHLAPYLRPHRAVIGVALGVLIAQAALRMLEPWPLKFVIDRMRGPSATSRTDVEALSSLDNETFLIVVALSLVVIATLRACAGYFSSVSFAVLGNRVLSALRDRLFRHLTALPLAFHDKARNGDLAMRVTGDIGMLKEVAVTAVMPLAGNLLVLAGMFGVMFWLHWKLTLVVLATLPLLWAMTLRRSHRIHAVAREDRRREGAMAATAAESIGAIRTVQALTLGDHFAGRFASADAGSQNQGVRGKRLAAGLERSVDILIAVATAAVLWYGAHLALAGELSAGELLIFVFYLRRAFRPMRDFAKYTARLAKAAAAGERIFDILERAPAVAERGDAVTAPRFLGHIRYRGVTFGYSPDRPVLDSIDLDIRPGERIAVVGASGSGKSTLTALLLRLYEPNAGSIHIDGRDIREFTLDSLRARIGVVLQDTWLFATSIRANLCAGRDDVDQASLEAAARLANIHDFIVSLPDGYDTAVGERGVTLSNGQRQRLSIARAALRDAPILILDEATTGLDPRTERSVLAALERLAEGRTTLLVTHRPETVRRADRVAFVHDGRLVCATHAALVASDPRYAALFGPAARDALPEVRHA